MEKIQDKALTASAWIWQSHRVTKIWQSLEVSWDTAEALWICGNDASVPKPCLNPESSSDEGFFRSNAVVQTSNAKIDVGYVEKNEPVIQKEIECSKLAQKGYKTRHNWLGKVIHWEFCDTKRWPESGENIRPKVKLQTKKK